MHTLAIISNKNKIREASKINFPREQQKFFNPIIQSKLSINQPNDIFEQEADVMADKVMRMNNDEPAQTFFKPAISHIQKKCAHCEEEEKNGQMKGESSAAGGITAPLLVHEVINSCGQPLDAGTRGFMESRFGHDFGNVQIHSDSLAHKSSADINALAYTNGNHIVFGSGQYRPDTNSGKQLLAHELTHVIQQTKNNVRPKLIQRAQIGYRQLTWADFKKPPDQTSIYSAETASAFGQLSYNLSAVKTTDTKNKCPREKKKTLFNANASIDPAQFDSIKAYMDQDLSWVKKEFKDDGKAECIKRSSDCEAAYDSYKKASDKICDDDVRPCQAAFVNNRDGNHRMQIYKDTIVAYKQSDCDYTFLDDCKKTYLKYFSYPAKGTNLARAKADCKGSFKTKCEAEELATSKSLLRHEQGHFDITNIFGELARTTILTIATTSLTATECGAQKTSDKIQSLYNDLSTKIDLVFNDCKTARDTAQQDYESITEHGLKTKEQGDWEKKIISGLKDYVPPSVLSVAAPTTSVAPATTVTPATTVPVKSSKP